MDKRERYRKQMVETKVAPLVVKLGIPTTISMLITNIYNLVDTYFVGTLGVSQQGATGILFTLQAILQAFAFMLGHGAGTHMTRLLAMGKKEEATSYACNAFYLGLAIGTLLLVLGLLFLAPFMVFLGSSPTILPYAKEYGFWVLVSGPFFIASLVLSIFLRYEGKANIAMVGIIAGALLNVFGDYLFIVRLDMGVYGAGLSTAISQFVSFVIMLIGYIKMGQVSLNPKNINFKGHVYGNILIAGLPSMLRQGMASISGGVLNNIAKPFGDAALAAMSVVTRYSNFVMCIGLGVGQGLQPVSAYNYAVKRYDRVREGIIFTIVFSSAVVAVISLFTLIFPSVIVSWFNPDEEVIELGSMALRFAAISLFFTPASMVTAITLQSVRKAWSSSFLSLLRNGLAFVPVIFLLVYGFGLGYTGVALSQPIADVLTFLISTPFLILFIKELAKLEKEEAAKARNSEEEE